MRKILALSYLLMALNASAATPEVGKDVLRKLLKLPTISFQPNWTFDPESGFTLGSSSEDVSIQITALQKDLKHDVNDAGTFLKLGDLYSANHDAVTSRKLWSRAATLYRQRLELQPDDPLLLAGFGRALQGAGQLEEAESVLRKAVHLGTKEWQCQVALGRLLDSRARADISGNAFIAKNTDGNDTPASRVLLAQRRLVEAGECFDRAVELAPDEAEPYLRRGLHRCLRNVVLDAVRLASGEQREDVALQNNAFPVETLTDLKHASQLRPRDYALIGDTMLFGIYTTIARKGEINWPQFSWSSLPDKSQSSIREDVTHLENLAQDGDPQLASGALEVLGILQGPVLHETQHCITNLRRAVALDPSRDQAWESLVATLAQSQRYDELLAVCEDRLKQKDTSRGHLLLAKAYEKLKQWDESEGEILIAVKQEPNNFTANLALAALLLKHTRGDEVLPEADSWLARSERLLTQTPALQRNQQQVIDLTLTRSIYFGLADQVDAAREWAQAVIKTDKSNKLAKDILSAMDY